MGFFCEDVFFYTVEKLLWVCKHANTHAFACMCPGHSALPPTGSMLSASSSEGRGWVVLVGAGLGGGPPSSVYLPVIQLQLLQNFLYHHPKTNKTLGLSRRSGGGKGKNQSSLQPSPETLFNDTPSSARATLC